MSEGGEGYQPAQPLELQQNEPLSDIQLGELISAGGNHEGKALTIAAMEPGEIYTARQLSRRLLEIQGSQPGWEFAYRLPASWCEKSLGPIGLVAQEVTDKADNSYGFTLTEYGEQTGKPFAGLILDWSKRHPEISLNQLFGNTQVRHSPSKDTDEVDSPQNRSPITRYKLLWELVTADLPLRTTDIAASLGKNPNFVGRHLQDLADKGVLEYAVSTGTGKPSLEFKSGQKIDAETIKAIPKEHVLIKQVYDILNEEPDKVWNREDLAKELIKRELQNETANTAQRVSVALGALRKLGGVEGIDFDFLNYSRVNMTLEQRNAIVELLETIDAFQKQEPATLQKGSAFADYFTTHPTDAAQLMAKVHDSLSSTNNLPPEAVIGMLSSIVEANPNSDIKTIREILMQRYKKQLTPERIQRLLNQGASEGKFIRTDNRESYWNTASVPSDSPQEHSVADTQSLADLSRQ